MIGNVPPASFQSLEKAAPCNSGAAPLHRAPEMNDGKQPCVFFDRDGIVNRDPHPKRYVEQPDEFHIFPAFIESLRVANEKGFAAVVITNQKGVGVGVMTQQALDAIHAKLFAAIRDAGLKLHDLYFCTSTDDAHPHRKPNPGMLLAAAQKHSLDLSRSWMIGDKERDITTGRRAGCKTVRVCLPEKLIKTPTAADFYLDSIEKLPDFLREYL